MKHLVKESMTYNEVEKIFNSKLVNLVQSKGKVLTQKEQRTINLLFITLDFYPNLNDILLATSEIILNPAFDKNQKKESLLRTIDVIDKSIK
ncbi:MAG: hypothetical protein RR922_02650 [Clostridia bacterium]